MIAKWLFFSPFYTFRFKKNTGKKARTSKPPFYSIAVITFFKREKHTEKQLYLRRVKAIVVVKYEEKCTLL